MWWNHSEPCQRARNKDIHGEHKELFLRLSNRCFCRYSLLMLFWNFILSMSLAIEEFPRKYLTAWDNICLWNENSHHSCVCVETTKGIKTQLNSVAWVRQWTIPTKRQPLVGEVSAKFCGWRGVAWSAWRSLTGAISDFLDRCRYFFFQVAPQLKLWGWGAPFQTHYVSGNLVSPRIEPGPREPNRLKLSVGLWRWYINITITILDIIHRPVIYLKFNSTL
jgi:hypothetical protein